VSHPLNDIETLSSSLAAVIYQLTGVFFAWLSKGPPLAFFPDGDPESAFFFGPAQIFLVSPPPYLSSPTQPFPLS